MEHADLGRITVGRWESAGVLGTIDLTGHIFLPASANFILINGGFFIRGPNGQVYATQWSTIGDPASNNPGRTEFVRYDSLSWYGFIYSASIAEGRHQVRGRARHLRRSGSRESRQEVL